MARYIDADGLLQKLPNDLPYKASVKRVLVQAPTADVVEVKQGEWIINADDFTPKMRCSVCGYNKPLVAGENIVQEPNCFCNNCGAKMSVNYKSSKNER